MTLHGPLRASRSGPSSLRRPQPIGCSGAKENQESLRDSDDAPLHLTGSGRSQPTRPPLPNQRVGRAIEHYEAYTKEHLHKTMFKKST